MFNQSRFTTVMEIRHLQLVKTVSEEGSLTNAAKKLHLSQSALSHQLRDLEEELNVSVFNRVNKKLLLTQAGQIILESSKNILNELNGTKREISKLVDGEVGTIRLSTQCYTCYHWLPSIMKAFKKQYPNIEIEIKAKNEIATVNNLLKGELDIALVYGQIKDPNIRYVHFLDDEMVVVFSSDHAFSKKEVILPSDFKKQTLITHTKDFESSLLHQKVLKRYDILPANISYVQLTGAALEMVKVNLGITVMPRWVVSSYLKHGQLKHRPLTRNRLVRKWKIATLKDIRMPSYIEYFIELLRSKEHNSVSKIDH